MKISARIPSVIAALFLANTAWAQQSSNSVGWQFGMGYASGGDDLAEIIFTNGESQSLTAGSGFAIYAGLFNVFDNQPLALQATIGYLVDDTAASDTNARMSRYPLDVILFYRNGRHRFGGGVTYHMSPTLDLDNLGGKIDFDNATGYLLEYGYSMFSVRYTDIDYSVSGFSGSVDGSSIGLHLTFNF